MINDMRQDIKALLEDAQKALDTAYSELREYEKTRDTMKLRDAAEKGWLAVNKAIEALLKAKGIEARTYREKRDGLKALGLDTLRDRFAAREKFLHIDCYYDGVCDEEFVKYELEKVREILKEVQITAQ